jgi:hypothetical protein
MGLLGLRKRGTPAYRLFGILACLSAVLAITAATTPASAGVASPGFDASLTGQATGGGGWCCGTFVHFQGSGVVMGVGAVDFTGTYTSGCSFSFPPAPAPCFKALDLLLVTRNGDRLAIHGDNQWLSGVDPAPQVTTWSVDESASTGRLADFTASGTYTFASESSGVLVALVGSRQSNGD